MTWGGLHNARDLGELPAGHNVAAYLVENGLPRAELETVRSRLLS